MTELICPLCNETGEESECKKCDVARVPPDMHKRIQKSAKENAKADDKRERLAKVSDGVFTKIREDELPKRVVGERTNSAAIFLSLCTAYVEGISFRCNILINSESSAGKDFVASSILEIFPKEMVERFSKATPEAFAYLPPESGTWDGRILYLSDVRQNTLNSDTLKVFATEGMKTVTVDKGKSKIVEINGIPVIILTTAEGEPKAEILNRYDLITLDETKEQTRRILKRQSHLAAGRKQEPYSPEITELLGFIEPVPVIVPYAPKIDEHMEGDLLRLRRDYQRFLHRIKASAALHQLVRERAEDGRTVIANGEDYENARKVQGAFKYGIMQNMNRKERADWARISSSFGLGKKLESPVFTVKKLFQKHPENSDRTWRRRIDKFLQLELLIVAGYETEEGSSKPSAVYQIKENPTGELKLPSFEELTK